MTSEIKTIIFDFGNVLAHFDYGPAFQRLRAFTHLSEKEIHAAIAATDLAEAYESGWISSEEFLERMTRLCQLRGDCDRQLLIQAWSDIFWLNQDVCDLIPRLKPRYRLLLGSNTNELHARHYRNKFAEVFQHFDELVLSYEVGVMKPKLQFFQRCHELAGCEPGQCVFIDDLAANIEGARAFGLKGIVHRTIRDTTEQLRAFGVRWQESDR